jgi:DNA polymerase-4
VTIKVRYDDFATITRSHSAPPTRDEDDIAARAVGLLDKTEAGHRAVRLLGVSVHNLCESDAPLDRDEREPRLPFETLGEQESVFGDRSDT